VPSVAGGWLRTANQPCRSNRELLEAAGLCCFGTDLEKTPTMDFVADFEQPQDLSAFSPGAPFGSALVLNGSTQATIPFQVGIDQSDCHP